MITFPQIKNLNTQRIKLNVYTYRTYGHRIVRVVRIIFHIIRTIRREKDVRDETSIVT